MKKIEPDMDQANNSNYTSEAKPPPMYKHATDIIAVSTVILLDLIAVSISLLLAYVIRNHLLLVLFPTVVTGKLLAQTFNLFWWYPLAFIGCLAYEKLYYKRIPFWIEVQSIFKAGTLTLFLTVVILYLVRIGDEISRSLVLLTWFFAMLALPFFRYYGKKFLLKLNIWSRPVIIIGNSDTIPLIHGALLREVTMGYRVVGCINSTGKSEPQSGLPCLGSLSDARLIINTLGVEDLVIAEPRLTAAEQVELTNTLQTLVKNIFLVPDLFGVSLSGIEAAYFFEEQVVLLQIKNHLRSRINSAIKRTFDLLIGSIVNIIALPLMLGIAIAIKVDSAGPVFYVSKRIGRGGKEFSCLKFRTMYNNAEQIMKEHLAANEEARKEWVCYNKLITFDPRLTRVGRTLRRLSLDELPQLINILHGEMSLVGPRPYLPREKEQMGNFANDILYGKPGLSGLWQVSGRSKLSFINRLKLDSWYMKNWSLWLDIILLLKTIRVVLKRDGAY